MWDVYAAFEGLGFNIVAHRRSIKTQKWHALWFMSSDSARGETKWFRRRKGELISPAKRAN